MHQRCSGSSGSVSWSPICLQACQPSSRLPLQPATPSRHFWLRWRSSGCGRTGPPPGGSPGPAPSSGLSTFYSHFPTPLPPGLSHTWQPSGMSRSSQARLLSSVTSRASSCSFVVVVLRVSPVSPQTVSCYERESGSISTRLASSVSSASRSATPGAPSPRSTCAARRGAARRTPPAAARRAAQESAARSSAQMEARADRQLGDEPAPFRLLDESPVGEVAQAAGIGRGIHEPVNEVAQQRARASHRRCRRNGGWQAPIVLSHAGILVVSRGPPPRSRRRDARSAPPSPRDPDPSVHRRRADSGLDRPALRDGPGARPLRRQRSRSSSRVSRSARSASRCSRPRCGASRPKGTARSRPGTRRAHSSCAAPIGSSAIR